MDTRLAAVKCLIKILEQNKTSDEVINNYAEKVKSPSELINLVFGTVKFKLALDYFIDKLSTRKKISPPVRNILRAAIYELEYLKTPDYAVINSYVDISKTYEKNSSGFVNAVLRNFLRSLTPPPCPPPQGGGDIIGEGASPPLLDTPYSISIKYSHPQWIVERWIKTYGTEETIKICEFNNKVPPVSVRINTLKSSKQEVMDLFRQNNIEFSESEICDECLTLKNTGNIKNLVGFKEGLWTVQGEASSLAAKILDPQKGERILDLCAAPGGKTAHIAALIQNSGEIVAVDISKDRIKKINENCERLGITCIKTLVGDAETFSDSQKFDRILIDAPCSNTGVFAKRPDARWKKTPDDIKSLTEIQFKILQNAASLIKVGGTLVYSTCSVEPEENILLVQKFLDVNNDFILKDSIQILQSKHNTDGFFIAKMTNSSSVN